MPGSAAATAFYLHGSICRGDGAYQHVRCVNICKLLTYVRKKATIRNRYNQASHLTQDNTRNISNNNDPVRIERTVHVYILHMSNVGIW